MRTILMAAGMAVVLTAVAAAQTIPPFSTARLYQTEALFERAIQPYQQAIAANARNARAQYWLGFAYVYAFRQSELGLAPYARGYLPKAIPPLQEAIKLDPANPDAYLVLHEAYAFMGDRAKADETISLMFQRTRPGWLPATVVPTAPPP